MSDCGVPGRPLAPFSREFPVEGKVPGSREAKAMRRAQSEPRRWNSARKKEHYDKAEEELMSLKCHDEMFANSSNAKFWTHLINGGVTPGGQSEKLDPNPKRKSGLHLKSGLYKGRFENVQHKQVILRKSHKHGKYADDRQVDSRPKFDNRLKDDMIRRNDSNDRELAAAAYEVHCPSQTRSCTQMGAEWMHR